MLSCKSHIRNGFLSSLFNLMYSVYSMHGFTFFQSDITDINEIFKDLGMMVHEQGDVIGKHTLSFTPLNF